MNLWDSLSNWTSSISNSIFVDERPLDFNLVYELFSISSFPFSVDSLWSVYSSLNSSLASVVSASCEISSSLSHSAKVVFVEVFAGNVSSALSLSFLEGERIFNWFNFTEFQAKLLREFSVILLGNVIFVLIAWKIYGPRISAKFSFTPARESKQVIEDLRLSMSELQLPNEHDYKLK